MSEKVNVNSPEIVLYFMAEAVTHISKDKKCEFFERFSKTEGIVDVEFKVNGVELPFVETLQVINAIMCEHIDRETAILAGSKKTLTETVKFLEDITTKINDFMADEVDPIIHRNGE